MTAARRTALLAFVSSALIAAIALGLSGNNEDGALAQGQITIAIDMDPYNSPANTCPGDGVHDCTVGSIDYCLSIPAAQGTTFDVDVLVTDLWNGYAGWNGLLAFPDTATGAKLTMTAQVEQEPLVNLVMQSPNSGPIISISETVPDPPGQYSFGSPHTAMVADFGTKETTPPWTRGVLTRVTFEVGPGAVPGVYGLSLTPDAYCVADQFGEACYDAKVLDYNSALRYGVLALGVPCPPLGTPTPTPTPSPTPEPTPPPTPPTNDDFVNALPIIDLPFTHTVDTIGASSEPSELHPCVDTPVDTESTVWYSFKPNRDTYVAVNSAGSDFYPVLAVYAGREISSLELLTCNDQGIVGFVARARTTYYLQAIGRGQLAFNMTLAHDAALGRLRIQGEFVRNYETKTQGVVVRNMGQTKWDQFDVNLFVWTRPGCTAAIDDPQTPDHESRNYIVKRVWVGAKSQRTLWFRITYVCTALSDQWTPEFYLDALVSDIHGLDPDPDNDSATATQDMLSLERGQPHGRAGAITWRGR
jgi:hypothetical protein